MYIFRETANFPMKIEFFFESLIKKVLQNTVLSRLLPDLADPDKE